MDKVPVILHGFWQSSCTWRARMALYAKRVSHVELAYTREQLASKEYSKLNPTHKVPALEIDGYVIVESMAILQYLEETRPTLSLLPRDTLQRARVREICEVIVSGIQPLQNIGIRSRFDNREQYLTFSNHFINEGLSTLETLLKRSSGGSRYCLGDQLTMADLCLVPQLNNAVNRFKQDISTYPEVSRLYESIRREELFRNTHPKTVETAEMKRTVNF